MNACQEFQELNSHISTLEGSISQHMVKEEQQVRNLVASPFRRHALWLHDIINVLSYLCIQNSLLSTPKNVSK